jgi:hypothetical protein
MSPNGDIRYGFSREKNYFPDNSFASQPLSPYQKKIINNYKALVYEDKIYLFSEKRRQLSKNDR